MELISYVVLACVLFCVPSCFSYQDYKQGSASWFGQGCPPHGTGQFPYRGDCKKFYNCFKGRGQLTVCAPGTLFNPSTLECDYPGKVVCLVDGNKNDGSIRIIDGRTTDTGQFVDRITHPQQFHHSPHYHHKAVSSGQSSGSTNYEAHSHHQQFQHNPAYHAQGYSNGNLKWSSSDRTSPHYHNWHQMHHHSPPPAHHHHKGHYIYDTKSSKTVGESTGQTYHLGVQPPGMLPSQPSRELEPPPFTGFEQTPSLPVSQSGNPTYSAPGYGSNPPQVFQTNPRPTNANSEYDKKFESVVPRPTVTYSTYLPPPEDGQPGSSVRFPGASYDSRQPPRQTPVAYSPNIHRVYPSQYEPSVVPAVPVPSIYDSSNPSTGGVSSGYTPGQTGYRNPYEGNPIYTADSYSTSTTTPKPDQGDVCPNDYNGLMAHSDCTKFLSCSHGRTFVMDCGPGTRFSPDLLVCDHAHLVKCYSGERNTKDVDILEPHESRKPPDTFQTQDQNPPDTFQTEDQNPPDTFQTEDQYPTDTIQTEDQNPPDTLQIGSRGGFDTEGGDTGYDVTTEQVPITTSQVLDVTEEPKQQVYYQQPTVRQPSLSISTGSVDQETSSPPVKHVFRPANITLPTGRLISKRNSTLERQVLRLRGGPTQFEGFVEMQLSAGTWGMVCDKHNKWRSDEAHIVCKTLGFPRGAELTWQGLPAGVSNLSTFLAADEVICTGQEESILECNLNMGSGCNPLEDGIWVRCYGHGQSRCHPGEMSLGDKCYSLVVPDESTPTDHLVGFTQGEALAHCQKKGGHLLDIVSQLENDFVSEWLVRQNVNGNIMTSGVGMPLMGGTIWIWEGSENTFNYHNWWPGWDGVKSIPPLTNSRAHCIVMRRHFPCKENTGGEDKLCDAQYYYWDIEDCDSMSTSLPYVCERPANKIGCVVGTGTSYKGGANVTKSGINCLNWETKQVLAELKYKISESDRKMSLSGHNYCRNVAGKETHPWCFVKDGKSIKKELCDIPICSQAVEKSARFIQCPPDHFSCEVNGECVPRKKKCDGHNDCSNARDEFDCTKVKEDEQVMLLSQFKLYEHKKLTVMELELFVDTPLTICARKCLERVNCRSFSYLPLQQQCLLSESNIGLSGALINEIDWNYYEVLEKSINCKNSFLCGNGKCIANETVCNGGNDCGDNTDEMDCSWLKQQIEIKLSGGKKPNEGSVEVKVFDRWGLICDDEFDQKDGDVICRHLGFPLGALEIKKHSYFKPNHTSHFIIDNLNCTGNESSLADCHHNGWGIHDCRNEEAAGVVCKLAEKNECNFNYWQCESSAECIPVRFLCDNHTDCADQSDEEPARCNNPFEVRLVGLGGESRSNKVTEGRVEVKLFGVWGTVCDDDFTSREAEVVCNSLGFKGPAQAYKKGVFGAGNGIIWLDQVHCRGNETSITECMSDEWGQTNCQHDEDVAVACSPQRLNVPAKEVSVHELEPSNRDIEDDLDDIFIPNCGIVTSNLDIISSDFTPRVVSGFQTAKGAYPWQASIRVKSVSGQSSHWCGAVVVSRYHVITAGHCLRDYVKAAYIVRAGDYDNQENEGTEQDFEIDEMWIHSGLDKGVKLNNDIAVVKIHEPGFKFNTWVLPACLPKSTNSRIPDNCTISGWGTNTNPGMGFARTLHATWISPLAKKECRSPFIYGDSLSDGMFCAGSLKGGPDTCQGDSGGPFLCPLNGQLTLFGITSWGQGCGRERRPGVYTNVPYYMDWVNEKIKLSMIRKKQAPSKVV